MIIQIVNMYIYNNISIANTYILGWSFKSLSFIMQENTWYSQFGNITINFLLAKSKNIL